MGARRRRVTAAGADLISGLGDDVLVHILELLPDARDLVRTGALSRRWRGLWTRVSALRFGFASNKRLKRKRRKSRGSDSGAKRDLAFVDRALAQRAQADDAALEHLAISFAMDPVRGKQAGKLVPPSIKAAQGWILYAVQHEVKSFSVELILSLWDYTRDIFRGNGKKEQQQQPLIILDELPSSAKLETMRWALDGATLRLPAAVVFASLADLSLESIEFEAGNGHLLAHLLSSACCPRLQKLQLRKLRLPKLKELLLEASTLSELSFEGIEDLRTLKLTTPSLRVLRMVHYPHYKSLAISAPCLEELTFLVSQPKHIEVNGGLPCMRSLKVHLSSHVEHDEDEDDLNDGGIRLLQCCTSAKHLEVYLDIPEMDEQEVDIISGRIPHLLHVTSLIVHVLSESLHSIGVGAADILAQCSSLKYLRVRCSLDMFNLEHDDFLCFGHSDSWESHEISLAHLQEVEFTGLAGTDCELRFMKFVLSSTTQLRKVTIRYDRKSRPQSNRDIFELVPLSDDGMWTTCRDTCLSYEWKPCQ